MRKRYRVLLIAAFVAALAGQFGYALSVQPPSVTPKPSAAPTASMVVVVAPLLVRGARLAAASTVPLLNAVPSAGKLLLVGTFLFGLSAVVRRAT